MAERSVLAVDLGAESGRVIRADFDGTRITMEDLHRFPNTPVQTPNTLHWDVLSLWHNIKLGIDKALDSSNAASSVGVDTWAVDFALLDRDGNLLSNPVHYRDARTEGMMEWVFERLPRREVFQNTGIQFMPINTLYHLASMVKNNSPLLDVATTLLTIPDLLNYWLSGTATCEFTNATTTQMFSPHTGDWARDMLEKIGIPTDFFTSIVQPGEKIGTYKGLEVIAPACHDTGSAVAGVPSTTKNHAYLSSGTWSLLGLEVEQPVISDASYSANVTNEGGVYGTYRLLKNIMGLWLAQQCRETWLNAGDEYSYPELVRLAEQAAPFRSFVDPDDPAFLAHGDMPSRIREYCTGTNQPVPETVGQIMRTVYESLALKYRYVAELLTAVSGQQIERLHVIGGGSQNALLNQMTANALGYTVIAGPTEATALGNAVVQLITLGELGSLVEAREMLSRTIATMTYEPQDSALWEEQYQRFKVLIEGNQKRDRR